MKDAKGHGSNARAVNGGTYEGKPVFHGVMSNGQKVTNQAGNKIAYASAEAALAGARFSEGNRTSMPSRPGTQSEFPDKVRQFHASAHAAGLAESADNYNRDLALRMKNGQVGSGMKFRG